MSADLMNYEQMRALALRGVVRDAIRRVIREDGLPGAHHFYITFLTRYPGVEIDDGLASKYPDEITIVLEHQFWDLAANADDFEVTLKFGGIPKYLKVPYHAITRFHDPSVSFSLNFDPPQEMAPGPSLGLASIGGAAAGPPETGAPVTTSLGAPAPSGLSAPKDAAEGDDGTDDTPPAGDDGPKVVSLDAFRKK